MAAALTGQARECNGRNSDRRAFQPPRSHHPQKSGCRTAASLIAILLLCACSINSTTAEDFAARATVRVDFLAATYKGHGSGVVIAPNRVLTAAHVAEAGLSSLSVVFEDGTIKPAKIAIRSAAGLDVVVLDVDTGRAPAAPIKCANPRLGDPIFTYGFPLNADDVATWGRVASSGTYGLQDDYLLDLTILPGNSGQGIWNRAGELVGMVRSVLAIPIVPGIRSLSGLSTMVGAPQLCNLLRGADVIK